MRKGYHGPLARSGNSAPPKFHYDPPKKPWLDIIHQDEDIVVFNKQAGLLSVSGKSADHQDCLELRAREQFSTATIIHRLDRGTSGIFIMALNANAHRHLGLQFEKRTTQKTYVALVSGIVREDSGTIEKALRTDWYNRPKQMIDTYMGREAITHWQVTERYENITRIKLTPKTGRSHQLRVHMQYLGHPIVGDTFYADEAFTAGQPRMMLHAEMLEVAHPSGGERIRFEAECGF